MYGIKLWTSVIIYILFILIKGCLFLLQWGFLFFLLHLRITDGNGIFLIIFSFIRSNVMNDTFCFSFLSFSFCLFYFLTSFLKLRIFSFNLSLVEKFTWVLKWFWIIRRIWIFFVRFFVFFRILRFLMTFLLYFFVLSWRLWRRRLGFWLIILFWN